MKTILIIERDRDFRSIAKKLILKQKWGAQLIEVETSEDGIKKARELKPEVVLINIYQRNIKDRGVEVTLKRIIPKCAVIMMTPFENKLFYRWYKTNDISAFILKDKFLEEGIPFIDKYLKE